MLNYEYLFIMALRDKLKERIKGRVYCEIKDDHLHVEITTKEIGKFEYAMVSNFSEDFINGNISVRTATTDITSDYRNWIYNHFIK